MSSLSERLKQSLSVRNERAADLARACGVQPSSVSDWLSGETKMLNASAAIKAARFLRVDPLWLIEGLGEPCFLDQQSPTHQRLLEMVAQIDEVEARFLLRSVEGLQQMKAKTA